MGMDKHAKECGRIERREQQRCPAWIEAEMR
jgi:hypothetical protein